jgi:hypothetical protein
MPATLNIPALFVVTDDCGRILRREELKAGADLEDRLRLAHRNYQLQDWACDPLLPGRWSFIARKGLRRLLVGIRRSGPEHARRQSDFAR